MASAKRTAATTSVMVGDAVGAIGVDARRLAPPDEAGKRRRPGRVPWASLIRRVFLNDVLGCGRCGGRMEIIAGVTSTGAVTRILEHLGLPSAPPGFHSARPPPQTELPFAAAGLRADRPAADGFEPDPPSPDDFGA